MRSNTTPVTVVHTSVSRHQKNLSEVAYDASGGGSYIGAGQLVQNVASRPSRLRNDVLQTRTVAWPPQIAELEQDECISPLLMKLITSLRKPGQVERDVQTLASMVTYCVTGKPTTTTINLSMTLYGLTRSKELIETNHTSSYGSSKHKDHQ